ncbi:MAG: hypothetical protein AABX63_03095 [Nanoarchaeota archaeon]
MAMRPNVGLEVEVSIERMGVIVVEVAILQAFFALCGMVLVEVEP